MSTMQFGDMFIQMEVFAEQNAKLLALDILELDEGGEPLPIDSKLLELAKMAEQLTGRQIGSLRLAKEFAHRAILRQFVNQ